MDLRVETTPTWTAFDAADLRANLRRNATAEDTLLTQIIASSTRYVENRLRRSLLDRTLSLHLPALPSEFVELPAPPLRFDAEPSDAVDVEYLDANGAWQAMPDDVYRVVKAAQVWQLVRGAAARPTAGAGATTFRVTFDVGYPDRATFKRDAADIYDAIMLHASHRDVNREATIQEPRVLLVNRKVEFGLDALLEPHRVMTAYSPSWI